MKKYVVTRAEASRRNMSSNRARVYFNFTDGSKVLLYVNQNLDGGVNRGSLRQTLAYAERTQRKTVRSVYVFSKKGQGSISAEAV